MPEGFRLCTCGHTDVAHVHGRTTLHYGACKVDDCGCEEYRQEKEDGRAAGRTAA